MTASWTLLGAKRQAWAWKLARAAALTALLVGLAPATSQADPMFIDCTAGDCTATFTRDTAVADYFFGYYTFRIGFDFVLEDETFDLTVTNALVSGIEETFFDRTFKCVEMVFGPSCVDFVVTGDLDNDNNGLPVEGEQFAYGAGAGAINVGVSYGIFGFPSPGTDPVDIGESDNFSTFMLFADYPFWTPLEEIPYRPTTFVLGHLHDGDTAFEDITAAHCGGSSITACAVANNFLFTVPEPASILLFGPGMAGLLFLKRRREGRS